MNKDESMQSRAAAKSQAAATEAKNTLVEKSPYKKIFIFTALGITMLLLFAGFIGALLILSDADGTPFQAIALFILTTWAIVFVLYFLWALYHYNINFGLTDAEWNEIYKDRQKAAQNQPISGAAPKEPEENPYKDQTFGLPPGTVRGMIAFTLLFGAIAMLIVSMGLTGDIPEDSFFWDHFEFFKTAFLMMIAFYFGDRSLRYLSQRWPSSPGTSSQPSSAPHPGGYAAPPSGPPHANEPPTGGEQSPKRVAPPPPMRPEEKPATDLKKKLQAEG